MGDGTAGRRAIRDGISRTQPPPPKGDAVLVARRAPQLRRRLQCTALDGAGDAHLHVRRRERGRRRGRDHLLSSAAPSTRRRATCASSRGAPKDAARLRSLARRPSGRRAVLRCLLPGNRRGESGAAATGGRWRSPFRMRQCSVQGSRRELYGDERRVNSLCLASVLRTLDKISFRDCIKGDVRGIRTAGSYPPEKCSSLHQQLVSSPAAQQPSYCQQKHPKHEGRRLKRRLRLSTAANKPRAHHSRHQWTLGYRSAEC